MSILDHIYYLQMILGVVILEKNLENEYYFYIWAQINKYLLLRSHQSKTWLDTHNAAHQFNYQVVIKFKLFLNHHIPSIV